MVFLHTFSKVTFSGVSEDSRDYLANRLQVKPGVTYSSKIIRDGVMFISR